MVECFISPRCSTCDCPIHLCDYFEDMYGIPVSDAVLEPISCSSCHWNTGKCEDCLFYKTPYYCPKETGE